MSVLLVGWVVAARIGLLATVGLLIWVFSGRYWFHVWGRLGPAESYAVFGAALWLYGIHLLWPVAEGGRRPRWRLVVGLVLFVIGNAVVIGVKESLLVLAVPNALLAVVETRAGRSGGARWWACVAGVVAAVAVATPLAIYYSSIEFDQYGRSVDPLARLRVLARGVRRLTAVHVAFLLALAVWIGTRVGSRIGAFSSSAAWRRLTSQLILASAGALGLFLVQFVLYNGDITPDTHYEFPTSLLAPALVVAAAILLRLFLQGVGASRAERVVYHVTGLVLVCLALLSADGLRQQRTMAHNWAKGTEDFTAAMRQAAAVARTAPDIPVVVTSGRPLDIEPILAVGRFLQVLGAANTRFLVLDWESDRWQWNALDRHLAPSVEAASRDGGLGYEPIARLRPDAPCFSIGLRAAPRPTCHSLGRLL